MSDSKVHGSLKKKLSISVAELSVILVGLLIIDRSDSVQKLLLLLLKTVGNARLGESDQHAISPKTPTPTIPTHRMKEEKGKTAGYKK